MENLAKFCKTKLGLSARRTGQGQGRTRELAASVWPGVGTEPPAPGVAYSYSTCMSVAPAQQHIVKPSHDHDPPGPGRVAVHQETELGVIAVTRAR